MWQWASSARVATIRSRSACRPSKYGEPLGMTTSSAPPADCAAMVPSALHTSSQMATPTRTPAISKSVSGAAPGAK